MKTGNGALSFEIKFAEALATDDVRRNVKLSDNVPKFIPENY
jgi:hypothetical protein